MYSLLQKKPTVQVDPYPHIVIEDALPWDLYEELENNFPESQVLNTEPFDNGICYRMKANRLLHPDEDIPEVWKKFTQYHTSAEWFNEVNGLFKPFMPNVLQKKFTENDLGARGWADKNKNIWTACQTVMHKPIDFSSWTPLIDNPREFYAALLYMPYKDDHSTGGEFQLHKTTTDITQVNKNGGRAVGELAGDVVKTVPYKRNTLVVFCNNATNTVHSVSARKNATLHRRSVNIIAEFNKIAKRSMFKVQELRK